MLIGRMLGAAAQDVQGSPISHFLEGVGGDKALEGGFIEPSGHDQIDRLAVADLAVERRDVVALDSPHGLDHLCAGVLEDLFLAGDDEVVHADGDHGVLLD